MKLKFLLFLLLCPIGLYAQYTNLLHKSYAERRPLLRGYYTRELLGGDEKKRRQAQQIVDGIAAAAHAGDDEDLALEAFLMQLHIESKWLEQPFDRLLGRIDSLRQVASAKRIMWLRARCESLAAIACFEGKENYELGFDYLYKLHSTIDQLSIEVFPEKQICYYQMGRFFFDCRDYENSVKYLKEGLHDTPAAPEDQLNTETISLIGVCYREMGRFDSALHYFREALQSIRFTRLFDNQWVGIVNGYIGHTYFLLKQYDAAQPCLQKCLDTAVRYHDISLASTALTDLGAISLERGIYPEAFNQLSQAAVYTRSSGYYKGWVQLYPLFARLYTAQGQHAIANRYLDSFITVKDSVDRKFSALLISRGKQRAELQEQMEIKAKDERKRLERNVLVAAVLILVSLSVYIYFSLKKKYQQQAEINRLELRQKQAELDFATTQLNDYAHEIAAKNKRVEELQDKLGSSVNEDVLAQLQQSTILTDDEWDHFRKLFGQVHGGYLVRLKEKLPDLSPAETRFMVLAKLRFSNKEMAATLGVSQHAVRITWHRLRRKLNLPEEGSLEELVAQI